MKSEILLITIRPTEQTNQYFRAIVAAGVLVTCMAQSESRAAIVLSNAGTSAQVQGSVNGGPHTDTHQDNNQYRIDVFSPPGGPFNISASPPPGTTTIDGTSSTANAIADATFTLDPVAKTLVATSNGSVTITASATRSATRVTQATARGTASGGLVFVTDQSYDYEIATSVSAVGGSAIFILQGISNGFQFERFSTGHALGASAGTLEPGEYQAFGDAGAGLTDVDAATVSENAGYQFTFQLTPASRWIETAGGSFQGISNWSAGCARP